MRTFIIGVENLVVEVDAKYIKGMINNPDIQPSATINRWIAGILLFDFKLRHVVAKDHTPADGLSRRPRSQEDPDEAGDTDEWIDHAYSFGVECLNRQLIMPSRDRRYAVDGKHHITTSEQSPKNRSPKVMVASLAIETLRAPRTDKAKAADEKMEKIREYLRTPEQLSGMSDQDMQRFVRAASEFFLLDEQLWKKDRRGRHKLVVREEKRLGLIRQAHDDLGHKGIFTV